MLHLKIIIRSWWRNKLSTIISLVSLTIGLVCSTILILFVMGEYRIANSLGDTDGLYMVERPDVFQEDESIHSINTSPDTGFKLKERYGDVESFATIKRCRWRFDVTKNEINGKQLYAVSEELCDMFTLPVLQGDLRSTLRSEHEIAVTDNFVRTLYGRPAKIGDKITAKSGGAEEGQVNGVPLPDLTHDVTITTILDDTHKTPLSYGALVKFPNSETEKFKNAYFTDYISIIRLSPNTTISILEQKVTSDSLYQGKYDKIFFYPFSDIYFDKRPRGRYDSSIILNRDSSLLTISLGIALAILVIAVFNYINITMTRARDRIKNIAGQIIFGATKRSVRWQTILDTMLLVVLSFGLSVAIINNILPQFNSFMDCDVALSDLFNPSNLAVIAGLLIIIVALSSAYILIRIEVSNPINSFKNPMGSRSSISSIMVIAQFVISIVLIVWSINISRQMNFIVSQRAVASSILQVSAPENYEELPSDFADRVISLAGVDSYSWSQVIPGTNHSIDGVVINGMYGDYRMVDFYEMELVEGRTFAQGESSANVVVNETLVKNFGIKGSALGQEFNFNGSDRKIVGVVKDFMYDDAHKTIQSLVLVNDLSWGKDVLSVKIKGDMDSRITEIRSLWKTLHPTDPPVDLELMTQIYEDMHLGEMRLKMTVELFTYISMALTALGLFGLAFYTVGRRSKEIAIRKIHGSTTAQVILRLCKTFAVWVLIAFVISVPAAYYFSSDWLSSFTYRVSMAAWVFIATAGIAVSVTFLTVVYQTWRAASANPADSIKSE